MCLLIAPLASAVDSPPPPDAADVVAAWQTLRRWIHAFDLPAPEDASSRVRLADADAACVILRREGRVIGTGTDRSGDALMLRRAAGRALGRVLSHPALSRLDERLRRDGAVEGVIDPEAIRATVGRSLLVELEVAGSFETLPGRTWEQIASQLEPGLDGVALRRGHDWALRFPAQLRASGRAGQIESVLPTLAADLGLAAAPLEELARRHDLAVYRFRTIHLAQAAPDRRPFETFRGDRLVPLSEITPEAIAMLADGIATHLVGTLWPEEKPEGLEGTYEKPPGVMGDYDPVADSYDPVTAPPLAQALVAFALGRYAASPRIDEQRARQADLAASRILHDLATWDQAKTVVQQDPEAAAATIYALSARPDRALDVRHQSLLKLATEALLDATAEGARRPDPHAQALIAGALARRLAMGDDGERLPEADLVRGAIDQAWRTVRPTGQVALLPWIAWAEADFAQASGRPLENGGAVRRLREVLHASQRPGPDSSVPADLHGGFPLRRGGVTVVDAQGTRPMVALGWMLGHPSFTTPEERPAAIEHQRQAMRFLAQLVARESTLWAYVQPDRVRGGVRQAAWDADQPVLAQAMGLLAAAETLGAIWGPGAE